MSHSQVLVVAQSSWIYLSTLSTAQRKRIGYCQSYPLTGRQSSLAVLFDKRPDLQTDQTKAVTIQGLSGRVGSCTSLIRSWAGSLPRPLFFKNRRSHWLRFRSNTRQQSTTASSCQSEIQTEQDDGINKLLPLPGTANSSQARGLTGQVNILGMWL